MTWPSAMRFRYFTTQRRYHSCNLLQMVLLRTGSTTCTRKNARRSSRALSKTNASSTPRLHQLHLKNHRLAAVYFNLPTLPKLWWLWI